MKLLSCLCLMIFIIKESIFVEATEMLTSTESMLKTSTQTGTSTSTATENKSMTSTKTEFTATTTNKNHNQMKTEMQVHTEMTAQMSSQMSSQMNSKMASNMGMKMASNLGMKMASHMSSHMGNTSASKFLSSTLLSTSTVSTSSDKTTKFASKKQFQDLKSTIEATNPTLMKLYDPKLQIIHEGRKVLVDEQKLREEQKAISKFNSNKVMWGGWIKYFKYNSETGPTNISNFFINPEYKEQFKRNPKSEKDRSAEAPDYVYLNGLDESTYYAELKKYTVKGVLQLNSSEVELPAFNLLQPELVK